MARRKRSAADRALFHMRPGRIAARFFSGGKHQTFGAIIKSPVKHKTVHTAKTGRRAYQQHMARERKAKAAEVAKRRKQADADQKAARAQAREQSPPKPRPQPAAVDPRTGKPITWAQAQKAVREANARADRLAAGLDGDAPTRRPRQPKPAAAPKTPLQQAIDEIAKGKPVRKKPAPKKRAARKPAKASRSRKGIQPLAPVLAGSAPPKLQRPGRTVVGVAMAATCACQGTGRLVVYKDGAPHGSTSCPTHGRSGSARGSKRWTMRGAIRESGLPGLAARLERKRKARLGNADERQAKAHRQAAKQVRHAGPTRKCGQCEGSSGIAEKPLVDRLRAQHVRELRAEFEAAVRAAAAHNAAVDEAGEGKKVKVPKMPSGEKLQGMARRQYPYDFCSSCKGLGRIRSTVNAPRASEAQFPVAEWRASAKLKKGHRLTARERATGKRGTENARRVERGRGL